MYPVDENFLWGLNGVLFVYSIGTYGLLGRHKYRKLVIICIKSHIYG